MFDITPFLNPNDPWLLTPERERVKDIYAFKFAIAAAIRPESVLEIGVRAGYSAASFLSACAGARYLGLDIDVGGGHGGTAGMVDWAKHTLKKFPNISRIEVVDTQKRLPFSLEPVDLAHVDGDHSYAGALRDLELVDKAGAKWILVDDVSYLPDVAKAASTFLLKTGYRFVTFPTYRGDTLIQTNR